MTHHFPFFFFYWTSVCCQYNNIKKREKLLLMLLSKEIWFNHFWVRWGVNLAMCLCRYGPQAPSGSIQDKKGRRWPGSYSRAINTDLFYFLLSDVFALMCVFRWLTAGRKPKSSHNCSALRNFCCTQAKTSRFPEQKRTRACGHTHTHT